MIPMKTINGHKAFYDFSGHPFWQQNGIMLFFISLYQCNKHIKFIPYGEPELAPKVVLFLSVQLHSLLQF